MSEKVYTIFGMSTPCSMDTLRSFSRQFQMPYVSIGTALKSNHPNSNMEPSFELFIRPRYSEAIVDLIRHYGWQSVYYVHDTQVDGVLRAEQLIESLSQQSVLIHFDMINARDGTDAHEQITTIDTTKSEEKKVIMLDMSRDNANELFNNLFTDAKRLKFHFLVIELGIVELNFTEKSAGGLNVTGFQMLGAPSISALQGDGKYSSSNEVNDTINKSVFKYFSKKGITNFLLLF